MMGNYALQFIAPFYCVMDGMMKQKGTGFFLNIGTRSFFVTAKHVFDRTECCDERGMGVGSGKHPVRLPSPVYRSDDVIDVGFVEIGDDIKKHFIRKAFLSAAQLEPKADISTKDCLVLCGFPGEKSQPFPSLRSTICEAQAYATVETERNPAILRDFYSDFHVAIEYPKTGNLNAKNRPVELADAHGLSGCPIWTTHISTQAPDEWCPENSNVVAIQHSVYEEAGIVTATRIECLLGLFASRMPELVGVFCEAFPGGWRPPSLNDA